MPLRGLGDDSLQGLRTAFSGKEKEKEKPAVDMGVKEV